MSDFSKEKEVSRRFAEIVRRNEFCQRVAEQLEREFGPCPARRDQLIAWVDEQLDRCTALGPGGHPNSPTDGHPKLPHLS